MLQSIIAAPKVVVLPTRAGTFPEDPALEAKRQKAKQYLGDRSLLKGGEYRPEFGTNPPFVGQK